MERHWDKSDTVKTPEKSQVAEFWDKHGWQSIPTDYWASNPIVQAYINRRTTGDANLRWMDWLAGRYIAETLDRGLCLACGAGTAEIHAIGVNICREMDACDISEASLEAARQKTQERGFSSRIRYFRCDLNQQTFEPLQYDIVLSSGGLHHVEHLEFLLAQMQQTLKPGGLFAVDEYVGPPRLQYTDRQLDTVNRIVEALPSAVRTGKSIGRPDMEYMLANDPSEAVRSAELLPLLEQRFEILEKRFYGGSILNVLFGSGAINPQLLLTQSGHADLLPLILLTEEMLNETGFLPSDYAVIVARNHDKSHHSQ